MEQSKASELAAEVIKTIYAYALTRVTHKEDAEDLAGDIVVAVIQNAGKLRDERAFYGYLWSIAANTCHHFYRRKKRMDYAELDETLPADGDFASELADRSEIQTLRRELALLSREYRDCTVAYYMDGLSCAEVSAKFGISVEMVKYYLFKTRKILREGLAMEREFGEKSYRPAPFQFVTIFSGNYNEEYRNLFNRRLPGNLLLSAYYTPMTIRELSVELGVASVYLEDEIALLEKYRLMTALSGGKYQTKLIICTESYTQDLRAKTIPRCTETLTAIYAGLRDRLDAIRAVGFIGHALASNRLLWNLTYLLLHDGYDRYKREHRTDAPAPCEIYDGAYGINYGVDYLETPDAYSCQSFAGFARIDDQHAAAYADFGCLPEVNRFNSYALSRIDTEAAAANPEQSPYVIMTKAERQAILSLLEPELIQMSGLYAALSDIAETIMRQHAPVSVAPLIRQMTDATIYFQTIGILGGCLVKGGILPLPDFAAPAAMYLYRTDESERDLTKRGCMQR